MVKFVVVTGGSISGLGKGTLASSMGVVLLSCGYSVTAIKIDPYLNVDAGTIAPSEHGEVFVLGDGHEGDLDLGNYERALGVSLTGNHNITSGKIYRRLIQAERNGDFLGATVQLVPHVTDSIQEWIHRVSGESVTTDKSPAVSPDICLIEVGGTVGDIESSIYLEALQQFFHKLPSADYCLCHVVYVPLVGSEQKTKCAQHSFRALREAGLTPDLVFCRSPKDIEPGAKKKISTFSGIPTTHVFGLPDFQSSYFVPDCLVQQNFHSIILTRLEMGLRLALASCLSTVASSTADSVTDDSDGHRAKQTHALMTMNRVCVWKTMIDRLEMLKTMPPVKIGFVAKYIGSNDTYLSVLCAIEHASAECMINGQLVWIKAENLEEVRKLEGEQGAKAYNEEWAKLKECSGVLVPGGFGSRGFGGMVAACKYAREEKIPYFGICLGMQAACVEAAQSFLDMPNAGSEEFGAQNEDRIIVFMPETVNQIMGGTMRLGNRTTKFTDTDSLAARMYDRHSEVVERHRHRYEFNTDYYDTLTQHGFRFVGRDETGQRLEVLEVEDHPFFIGCQYHPELLSKPAAPSPLFLGFVLAAAGQLQKRLDRYNGVLRAGLEFTATQ